MSEEHGVVVGEGVADLRVGERLAIIGPNGAGKTTLLRAMLGELAPMRGSLRIATRCGVVPQTERSRLDYPVSALDVALMGSLSHLPWWRRPGRAERHAALDALDAVGLRELAGETFGELSGGQRQRVLVARGLVQEAGLLLLDEPFSGLDSDSAERLEQLIAELAAGGRGVIVATHDLEQARPLRPRVVPEPPPDRIWRAGSRPRPRGPGGHLPRGDRRGPRRAGPRDPPSPPSRPP